jgi:ABC-type transporter Mla MlaB component
MKPFTLELASDCVRLALAGDVTIEHAAALHAELCAMLTADRRLELDASAATRIDAAILQLLVAATRLASAAQALQPSPAWSAACARLGLPSPFTPAPEPDHRHA